MLVGGALVGGASAWSQAAAAPKYTIALENERVRVRDVTFPPGVLETGMHTHKYAHVGVILTEGALLFTDPAGKTERVEFKAGSVGFPRSQRHAPGREPRHLADARHRGRAEAVS